MSILETFTKSETDPSKHKCGDYVAHEYLYGKYWVLALADGVGSRPCDWSLQNHLQAIHSSFARKFAARPFGGSHRAGRIKNRYHCKQPT